MSLVHPDSLAATLETISDELFFGRTIAKRERDEAARWIAARQGLPGSYRGMFAPTERDRGQDLRLFTGERIRTGAARAHILGEEACRALLVLNSSAAGTREALGRAGEAILHCLDESEAAGHSVGRYCCGACSASLWRHLAAGGLKDRERRLAGGVEVLKAHRQDGGRWRAHPFYYTLLALTEIKSPQAVEELRHARGVCERLLRRAEEDDPYDRRRRRLAERVLEACG
ncbi:MAG: hypothetical protein NTW86_10655 [Candidatus Sumerlaeota bacterium]|nr:hypothetical protein [Candidatus Sumerlaeota bacterium]